MTTKLWRTLSDSQKETYLEILVLKTKMGWQVGEK